MRMGTVVVVIVVVVAHMVAGRLGVLLVPVVAVMLAVVVLPVVIAVARTARGKVVEQLGITRRRAGGHHVEDSGRDQKTRHSNGEQHTSNRLGLIHSFLHTHRPLDLPRWFIFVL